MKFIFDIVHMYVFRVVLPLALMLMWLCGILKPPV